MRWSNTITVVYDAEASLDGATDKAHEIAMQLEQQEGVVEVILGEDYESEDE